MNLNLYHHKNSNDKCPPVLISGVIRREWLANAYVS